MLKTNFEYRVGWTPFSPASTKQARIGEAKRPANAVRFHHLFHS
jgi:hypothetical protein